MYDLIKLVRLLSSRMKPKTEADNVTLAKQVHNVALAIEMGPKATERNFDEKDLPLIAEAASEILSPPPLSTKKSSKTTTKSPGSLSASPAPTLVEEAESGSDL